MTRLDTFSDVLVVPYQYLLQSPQGFAHAKGGPIWPDWKNSIHRHLKGGIPIDWDPEVDPSMPAIPAGEAWWAGACCNHFGHQVVDFSSKLALYSEMLAPSDKIAVATKIGSGMVDYDSLPAFAHSIYTYFGFGRDRIHVVSEPTRFSVLHSIQQQEQHGGGEATAEHLAALSRCAENNLDHTRWSGGRFYISRSQVKHGGGIAGEADIDRKMEAAGYQVVYPERMPLTDQLGLYAAASELVFQEGSALHGLQLLGPIPAKVTILVRRPGFRMLEPNLRQRIASLSYVAIGDNFVCGLKSNGKPADANGILIPDEAGLQRLAHALDIADAGFTRFDKAWDAAISRDLQAFLARERASFRSKNPEHMGRINAMLGETRFAELAGMRADTARQ